MKKHDMKNHNYSLKNTLGREDSILGLLERLPIEYEEESEKKHANIDFC